MSVVEWQGREYPVPAREPPQDREVGGLYPPFRHLLQAYVAFAQRFLHYELRIGECRRTLERQVYLYAQGRVDPYRDRRIVSWTLDSKHRYGLAADLVLVDTNTRPHSAVWTPSVWRELYRVAPPQWFGLTPIANEYVHLEHAQAAQLIDRAAELDLYQT